MCRALLCGDDSSHSQSQSGKRLLLASRGQTKSAALYHGSCIDPTHQSHTLDLTSEAPILRLFPAIQLLIEDNRWQELHFEFSCQNLNRGSRSEQGGARRAPTKRVLGKNLCSVVSTKRSPINCALPAFAAP